MKTRFFTPGLFFLAFIAFSACRNEILDPRDGSLHRNAKLKRILLYSSKEAEEPIAIVSEYEYDSMGRISKVTHPMYEDGVIAGVMDYEIYEYNSRGLPEKIMSYNYNANPGVGFVSTWTRQYSYDKNGRVTNICTSYRGADCYESLLYIYEYNLLTRIEKYNFDDALESFIINEYNHQEELVKEMTYAWDGQAIDFTLHTWTNGLNTRSDFYGFRDLVHAREIIRTFDQTGKLLILESNELVAYSSAMSHVLKYEYY